MNSAFVFLVLVALSHAVSSVESFNGRVINGEDAKEGEFPYQVSLQVEAGGHICGGSIINKEYVITAAHCVAGSSASELYIFAGTINLIKPQTIHKVVKIIAHSKYNPGDSYVNDIALVKVSPPFISSKTISSVSLPDKGTVVPAETIATTSGWGSLIEGHLGTNKLQRTDVLIASQEYCNRVNGAKGLPIYPTQICIFNPEMETGPCHGDSGGPLTVDGKLVGITSWGFQCASSKYPTVFTRVSEYRDWIKAQLD